MIFNYNEEFNLKNAIINDEVDLIFGFNENILNEAEKINGRNKMKMLIRNKEQDNINHSFTMKFIPDNERKNDKNFYHNGHYGLPISFDKETKEWNVDLGDNKEKKAKAKRIKKDLTRKERSFITSIVDELGDDIIKYWEVKDIYNNINKLNNIVDDIRRKYEQ